MSGDYVPGSNKANCDEQQPQNIENKSARSADAVIHDELRKS